MTPNAYTLGPVLPVNGSSAHGNCPTPCVVDVICDCTALEEEAITGVIIDGVIPTIETSQMEWASGLYTMTGRVLSVRFSKSGIT